MARTLHKLKPLTIERERKPGRHSDGGGLYLNISNAGSKSWVFMWNRKIGAKNKRYEMGLGSSPAVTLKKAREKAQEARSQVADGLNPIDERRKEDRKSFGEVANEYVSSIKSEWSNAKHEYQWRQSLETHCAHIRELPIEEISTENILSVLKPMWEQKHETASRVRARIERVIDYAHAKGWRQGENPARWRGHLKNILPKKKRGEKIHLPAMPYDEVPNFIGLIRQRDAIAARALEFTILTAARTSETLLTKWNEIDLDNEIWTVPSNRMKMRRVHRVPLSKQCIDILKPFYETRVSEFVFPGNKTSRPLSNMAMNMLLRRLKIKTYTTHGFRSSFRDWAGDKTSHSRETAEAALSHQVGDETEQAYRRGDALDKRRKLMDAWADYCCGVKQGKVVQLHAQN